MSSIISRRITIMSYPIVCFNIFLYIYFNAYDENVAYLDLEEGNLCFFDQNKV